jgi:ubiquinone/menaquinone biosynthesis C-methylase UbiE
MSVMNNTEYVKKQYADDKNLAVRVSLHAKYSTNKYGFINWLFDKYKFSENIRILELGCGSGAQWEGRINLLPKGTTLVLSDFSSGMVDILGKKYSTFNNVLTERIDIQDIPFSDNIFDVVIANHMLYHVPDLIKAISEVSRVLKSDGTFYTATNGAGGMRTYLHNALKQFNPKINAFNNDLSFNLQNGTDILKKYFKFIERFDYIDSLTITDTQDLVDWIKSTITISNYTEDNLNGIYEFFENIRKKEGSINIQKETGLFISHK